MDEHHFASKDSNDSDKTTELEVIKITSKTLCILQDRQNFCGDQKLHI